MWPFGWLERWWISRMADGKVAERYRRAGAVFGDAVSYLYMGECIGFKDRLDDWALWEKEYARRGYATFSIDAFVELGGYGRSIEGFGRRLKDGEVAVLHAEIYREKFLGQVEPVISFEVMLKDGRPQFGKWSVPSTKNPGPRRPPYRSYRNG